MHQHCLGPKMNIPKNEIQNYDTGNWNAQMVLEEPQGVSVEVLVCSKLSRVYKQQRFSTFLSCDQDNANSFDSGAHESAMQTGVQ
jgi:hypothetical protein